MTSIADNLLRARRRNVVGRDSEIALFRETVQADTLPFCLLAIYGPGGVGKTTLVQAFRTFCAETGVRAAYLDGRNFATSPPAFLDALHTALDLPPDTDTFAALSEIGQDSAGRPVRLVLFVDTYETLESLSPWLREVFLPRLPSETLTVLAGRHPLGRDWLSDAGWRSLIHTIALRNLHPDDSRLYLTQRAVPPDLHKTALDFTYGHPLALSLMADVLASHTPSISPGSFLPEDNPDIVQTLLERFVDSAPDAPHRAALEVCALVRHTDESVLSSLIPDADDAGELFGWLRGLSFIEATRQGVFPHDVVRETLLADLRWRNRDRYVELHRKARDYYAARLSSSRGAEQQKLLYDCIFLHRDNGVVRTAFHWQENPSAYGEHLRPVADGGGDDLEALVALVERHEGAESAQIARQWLLVDPGATLLFRDLAAPENGPLGFFTMLALHDAPPSVRDSDPAAQAAWHYLETHTPLRGGEAASYLRFWMARDGYQEPSPVQSMIIVHALRHYLTQPRLAYTFFACAIPELWEPVFNYADIARLPAAEFTIGERAYGVYAHDWRARPATAWLAGLFEKEVAAGDTTAPAAPPARRDAPIIVLSEPDFAGAVRDALRHFHRPDALAASPLLQSRVVIARSRAAHITARTAALRALIQETANSLQAAPRQARGYRALLHTYLQPATTQEAAAELLDLPFNTYRRHLGEGIAQVSRLLWLEETGQTG